MWYIVDIRSGRKYWIPEQGFTIACDMGAAVLGVTAFSPSRHYAVVQVSDTGVEIDPLGSIREAFIAGQRVLRPTRWQAGEMLVCGSEIFQLFDYVVSTDSPTARLNVPKCPVIEENLQKYAKHGLWLCFTLFGVALFVYGFLGWQFHQTDMKMANGFVGQLALLFGGDAARSSIQRFTVGYDLCVASAVIGGVMLVSGIWRFAVIIKRSGLAAKLFW